MYNQNKKGSKNGQNQNKKEECLFSNYVTNKKKETIYYCAIKIIELFNKCYDDKCLGYVPTSKNKENR
jgi:hypothetical protein